MHTPTLMSRLIYVTGFLAALTSTASLIPQIIKTYKTRSSQDLSTLMLINFLVTSVLWVAYGLMTTSLAVWSTNIIMVIFSIVMLGLKLRY